MEREEEIGRRRGGKTILKSGQAWTLPAQQGQLKTGQTERDYCEVICGARRTIQDYRIEQNRIE